MNYAENELVTEAAASGASSDEEAEEDDGGGKPRAKNDDTATGDDDDDDDTTYNGSLVLRMSMPERIQAFCQLVTAAPSAADEKQQQNIGEIPHNATLFDAGTSKSIIYQNGVRLEWPDSKAKSGKKHRWFCLVGDCAKSALGSRAAGSGGKKGGAPKGIPLDATTTKNATAHLTSQHGITSQRTLVAALHANNTNAGGDVFPNSIKKAKKQPSSSGRKKKAAPPLDSTNAAAASSSGAAADNAVTASTEVTTPKKKRYSTTTTTATTIAAGFAANPAHSLSLLFATHSVLQGINTSSIGQDDNNNTTWNVLADVIGKKCISSKSSSNNKQDREQFKHMDARRFVMEQYVYVKEKIVHEIHAARHEFDMPFLSFSLHVLSSSHTNNSKTYFLGLRVNFVNADAHFKSHALGFRAFHPAWHARTNNNKASSDLIMAWVQTIFAEFGIDATRDVVLGSGSTGSVIVQGNKHGNSLTAWISEWSMAYRIDRALAHTFAATTADSPQEKHMLTKVRKTLETAYKSDDDDTATAYNEVFRQDPHEGGPVFVLTKTPERDWQATETVLHRLLGCWDMIEEAYRKSGKTFALNSCDRTVLGELYSVLHPMRRMQELAQRVQTPIGLELYICLANAYQNGFLCPSADLKIIDTSSDHNNDAVETLFGGGKHQQGPETRPEADLDPRTTALRSKLRLALNSRFYDRFHPVLSLGKNWEQVYGPHATVTVENVTLGLFKFGYAYEIQAFFHPRLRDQQILKDMCMAVKISESSIANLPANWRGNNKGHLRLHHYNLVKAAVEKHIMMYVTMVAMNHVIKTSSPSAAAASTTTTTVSKKRRLESTSEEMLLYDAVNCITTTTMTPPPTTTTTAAAAAAATVGVDPPGTGTRIQATILVEDEMKRYREAASRASRGASMMSLDKLIHWWHFKQRAKLPCLYQVAMVYFAVNPGAGCCDAGPLGGTAAAAAAADSRRHSGGYSLESGLAEAELFLRWNRSMVAFDSTNVKALPGDQWKAAIPTRPKFPVDYMKEESERSRDDDRNNGTAGDCCTDEEEDYGG
jgi:hypothetical protein